MGVCIRLKRLGSNKRPYFRVVVADSARATQGKALESLGVFDPLAKEKPVRIDVAKLEQLRQAGATVSSSVARLAKKAAALQKA